jgi:glycosyltransferase involved in cell wall biosynthesis
MSEQALVVGVVTYNNLPMLQKCFDSWRKIPNSHLVVWDNGSEPETTEWLKQQPIDKLFLNPTNAGLCVGRNRIIEYNREVVRGPFILLLDSDVLFHEGSVELMLEAINSDPSIGMVGFGQANQGFPLAANGYVEEASNECILSRMDMWREIGLFPESLIYYSSDSWKSTLANMHGWKTKLVTSVKGYDHFAHGSHVNKPVPAIMRKDQEHWMSVESKFQTYWRQRLLLGKGNVYKADMSEPSGADWAVPDEIFEPNDRTLRLLKPTVLTQFTNWIDCQALTSLMNYVNGNYLELGCHQGLTLMQIAYNFPHLTCYGVDYSGRDIPLPEEQEDERPTSAEIGMHVRAFRNAKVFDVPIQKLGFSTLEDVALTFIDASLTYEGVKMATERVLEYYYALPVKRRIIAWHDYTPLRLKKEDDWIGVGEYVRKELSERFVCRFVRNTNLAYMIWNGER